MANAIRSAKSASNWGISHLLAYNITVDTAQPPEQFFRGNPNPPLTGVDPSLIDSAVDDENISDAIFEYLGSLHLATKATPNQRSFVNHFALETLRALGFVERGLAITSGYNIPLIICGDDLPTQTDICLLDRQLMILLVLHEDKTNFDALDPEPQVIAEAIAAFQYNNREREDWGLPTLDAMTIPCIIMVGSRPTFYLVPVTKALSIAVMTGQYPEARTTVVKCITFSEHSRSLRENMETPAYRRVAFQRFLAFKDLAKEYWQTFIV